MTGDGQTAAAVPKGGLGRLRMPRVLVMSPDAHVLSVMKSSLERHGFDVDTALAADVAMQLYEEIGHEAVVIDDGSRSLELCRMLLDSIGDRTAAPFLLAPMEEGDTTRLPPGVERLDKPLSLRYLVARLTGHLGYFPISA